ncbi:hypothetical protein Tco_0257840 [Tanacetum coccineum]
MAKMQEAASDIEDDTAPTYATDALIEVPNHDIYSDNDMFNMFAHEKQHSKLHESIQGTYVEQEYDPDMDFIGGDVEKHGVNDEETPDESLEKAALFEKENDPLLEAVLFPDCEKQTTELSTQNAESENTFLKKVIHEISKQAANVKVDLSNNLA